MTHTDQLAFDSIMFPRDRRVLMVAEVANLLRITEQHVIDLIEEGKLRAINTGGGSRHYWRIPREAYEAFITQRDSINV